MVVEDGVGEGAGGSFALCACDVDDVEAGEVGGLRAEDVSWGCASREMEKQTVWPIRAR